MRNTGGEAKWQKRLVRAAECLDAVTEGWGTKSIEGGVLRELRILLPSETRGDCLMVLKASRGEERLVGFVGGPDVVTALLTWRAKEEGQGLKFRQEEPYRPG